MGSFWPNFTCRVVLAKYDKNNNKSRVPQFPNFDCNNIFLSNTSYILCYITIFLYIYIYIYIYIYLYALQQKEKKLSKLQ